MYNINTLQDALQETEKEIKRLDLSEKTKEKLLQTLKKEVNGMYDNVTICEKKIREIVQILNGLDIEKMLDIKMTMENLSYLYKKVLDEQYKKQQMIIKRMMFGDDK